MNPHLQNILHDITVRLTKLEEAEKRSWVSLTDEEIMSLWPFTAYGSFVLQLGRYVEAKLKEKNHG